MKNGKKIEEVILLKLDQIENKLDQVRTKDIPNLKIEMEVIKVKTSTSAKIIAGIGGAITLAVSTAIAWFN